MVLLFSLTSEAEGQSLCKLLLLVLLLIWKILFGEQIYSCSKLFLVEKLTYKSPLNALTPGIYASFLISAGMMPNLSSVKALCCKGMLEKFNLPV